MKSLFADFLQNVTPPGAFKRGYTVHIDITIYLDFIEKNKELKWIEINGK